jgi:Amidohydrolase family
LLLHPGMDRDSLVLTVTSVLKRLLAVFGLLGTGLAAIAAEPPALVIRGASVFTGDAFAPSAAVVVVDGRILAIVPPGEAVIAPPGAIEVDGANRYLLPGFIDGHAHVSHLLPAAGVTVEEVLPHYLANGITTMRAAGDTLDIQQRVQRYSEDHPELAPRLVMASPLFDKSPPYHAGVSLGITDPAQIAPFVDRMAEAGVWTFKIYVGMDRRIGSTIIREAHRHGRWVTAHLRKYHPLDAMEDGIDSLEHIESVFNFLTPPEVPEWLLRDERTHMSVMAVEGLRRKILEEQIKTDYSHPRATQLIDALVRHQVAVNPTLVVYRSWMLLSDTPEVREHPDLQRTPRRLLDYWLSIADSAGASPETQELRRKQFAKLQELTGLLHRSGVELLVGTDAPFPFCPPGFSFHQELELMVASGIPPAAVLVAATKNNARAINLASEIGEIAPGRRADLVLLDANPLEDIRNTRKITAVVRGGLLCDPAILLR